MSTREMLEAAADNANGGVLAASMVIMDPRSTRDQRAEASVFQSIFSAIRGVLSEAARGYWEPGRAPEDWESHDSSKAVLKLAESILDIEKNAAGVHA